MYDQETFLSEASNYLDVKEQNEAIEEVHQIQQSVEPPLDEMQSRATLNRGPSLGELLSRPTLGEWLSRQAPTEMMSNASLSDRINGFNQPSHTA